tara:strand:- start:3226 stop:5064 length:1839 start_codon:yes stop_codon:yes gene_type:complete
MATTIKSTALDFESIKSNLKTFLKSKSEFTDYDFEASGLSNILDVLAYNTHFNGLTANFALNETFLDTAQLRSSVVSHAEALGYEPRSSTSSSATINVTMTISDPARQSQYTLTEGTTFTASVDGVSYTFVTREDFTAQDDNGTYVFKTTAGSNVIPIFEGSFKTRNFFVGETGERQIYVLPDTTIDTSTLVVDVFESSTSSSKEEYTNLNAAVEITTASTHYEVKETPNGFYELAFGDGISTGKAPAAGSRIRVKYVSTNGAAANTASSFTYTGQAFTVNNVNFTPTTALVTQSAGGAAKESIESVRLNARTAFSSQNRLVTAKDYESQILSKYGTNITDVTAYGGQDNVPPKYNAVYVSLKFADSLSNTQKADIKNQITQNLTDNLAIAGVETIYIDPIEAFLELDVFYNFDPDLTSLTSNATANNIKTQVETHFNNNLKKFDKVFRRSLLTAEIDDLDDSILNSRMTVKVQQRITPSVTAKSSYELAFPMLIAVPDATTTLVSSSNFTFQAQTCSIRNRANSTTLEIVNNTGDVLVDNIGNVTPSTGKLNLTGFLPTAVDNSGVLKIAVRPANESTIRPLRNYIIDIDSTQLNVTTQVDFQNTETVITT